jgi:hypothetical protein
MPENPNGKREKDLLKAYENRKHYEDTVRRMRARLDRTSMSSSSRKPLEKAFKKLIRGGPSVVDELNEEYDE